MGIVGMTHDHVHQVLNDLKPEGVEIVGFAEPNKELAMRHFKSYGIPDSLYFSSMEEMIAQVELDAVCDFRDIKSHYETVSYCAPRGIHVMVEKPLHFDFKVAQKMAQIALKNNIELLTNYETTWYASHHAAKKEIENGGIGKIRKVVVHDGHKGPKEIGISKEFMNWLGDPEKNGGGAIIDFGCYGADLTTWLINGERPLSVTAHAQNFKPKVYPKVDDEATIVVTYKDAVGIFQASWNWPFDRKDIEIYGETGYIFADRKPQVTIRDDEQKPEYVTKLDPLESPVNNPFTFFAASINGEVESAGTLGGLDTNLLVVEILDAAVKSAKEGRTIFFKK